MRHLITCAMAAPALILAVAQTSTAQHKAAPHQAHNGGSPPHQAAAPTPAPMHFPSNAITFPNNAMTFPNNGFNFPSNAMNFPSNAITFPNGSMNFTPNGVSNYGSINSINGWSSNKGANGKTNFAAGSQVQTQAQARAAENMMAGMMLGMPMAYGAGYHGGQHHYGHRSNRYPHYRNTSYRGTNANQGMSPAERHYQKVVSDLDSLPPRFQVADAHRNTLKGDMAAMIEGNPKPDAPAVQKLAHNLADAMTRRKNLAIDTADLAGDLRVVLNGHHLPKSEVDEAIQRSHAILKDAGIPPADLRTVVADMHAVVAPSAKASATTTK